MDNKTLLLDEHLLSVQDMKETATDDFFYTRLKARMDRERSPANWSFPMKPVWIVSTLIILLAVNGFILSRQFKSNSDNSGAGNSSLQNFARSYDQSLSPAY